MSKNDKNIPKRRFKDFENAEAWELRKLTDEIKLYRGLTYSPNDVIKESGTLVLRSSNVKNGEIVDADNVYVNSEIVNSDNVQVGDIIVVVRNGSRSLIGKHAQIKEKMDNTVIGAFMTGMRSTNSSFINALLNTSTFENEVEKNLGATINQITNGMFQNMQFMFPGNEEQRKIGNYFTNIDTLITLHQCKLEKMKALKKAYLTEMFPAEGERKPKRRFTGFTDDWEQRKVGDIAEIVSGGTPDTNNPDYWDGDINWYAPAEITDQIYVAESERKITELGLQKSSAKMLPAEKTILFTSRAGIGKVAILRHSACTNQGFQSLVLKDDYEPYFVYSMGNQLKEKAEAVASGSTFLEISGKMLANLDVMMPNREEQMKIASYFQGLDNLITLHQRKLNKLHNIKKAYLDEMFI